jgi:hypothetical protein
MRNALEQRREHIPFKQLLDIVSDTDFIAHASDKSVSNFAKRYLMYLLTEGADQLEALDRVRKVPNPKFVAQVTKLSYEKEFYGKDVQTDEENDGAGGDDNWQEEGVQVTE